MNKYVIDFPSYILNILFYLFVIVIGIFSIPYWFSSNALNGKLIYSGLGCFFIGMVINALIQNFSFDKKFKPILSDNKSLLIDISGLPNRWVVNLGLIRGLIYAGSIFYTRIKRPATMPIVNYFSSLPQFRADIRMVNFVGVWLLLLSVVIFISLVVVAIVLS